MNFKKELPSLTMVVLPILYLAFIWNELPNQIPIHWNIEGQIDGFTDKSELIYTIAMLPLFMYVLFIIIPKIDPKRKLSQMGNKYQILKFSVVSLMSLISLYIIYISKNQLTDSSNMIEVMIGFLFIILGNFFQTIKPNYFIGIRTPWTLESEKIWKKTHQLAGKLWFVGGIIIVLSSLILEPKLNTIILIIITIIVTLVPVLYSYLLFTKEKKIV